MATKSKPWYKSKTVWFNVLTTVASFSPQAVAVLGPHAIAVVATANIILRFITATSVVVK